LKRAKCPPDAGADGPLALGCSWRLGPDPPPDADDVQLSWVTRDAVRLAEFIAENHETIVSDWRPLLARSSAPRRECARRASATTRRKSWPRLWQTGDVAERRAEVGEVEG
jgi:hypothetical protein